MVFMVAATWADRIKSDAVYVHSWGPAPASFFDAALPDSCFSAWSVIRSMAPTMKRSLNPATIAIVKIFTAFASSQSKNLKIFALIKTNEIRAAVAPIADLIVA